MAIYTDDLLAAGIQRWDARAWVDGVPVTLVGGIPTRTMSGLFARSTATMEVVDLPPSAGKSVQIDLILDGYKTARYFTGLTNDASASAAEVQRTANLIDILNLDKAVPSLIIWHHTSFVSAVTGLLAAAGITSAQIDEIYDPGGDYTLGPVYDIAIKTSESIRSVFDNLMAFGGAVAYVTPSGRVRVVQDTGVPMGLSNIVYAEDAPGALEFGIINASFQTEGNEAAISSYTATGPKRPDGTVPDGTFTAAGVTGKPGGTNYPYAQSDTVCQKIAKREIGKLARRRRTIVLQVPLNPNVLPGDTILIRVPSLGYVQSTPAIVLEAKGGPDGAMDLTVATGPSLIDGYSSSIAPPVVDFAMLVETQPIVLAGVPITAYLIQCQDQSRDKAGYALTGRSWAASGSDVTPSSSNDEAPIFTCTNLTGVTITLTVNSASGESASQSATPTAPDVQVVTRVLSVAAGADGWLVLDPAAGWRSYAGTCTAVPAIGGTDGRMYAGFDNGDFGITTDLLATEPEILVGTFPDSVGCIWVNEGTPAHILVGAGSILYRSTDSGSTWNAVHTFDAAIADTQSSAATVSEIRVATADVWHISFDGGASWGTPFSGVEGAIATMLATAPWGHACTFSGSGLDPNSAVGFEEAYTIDWTGVATPPTDGLTSITPLLDQPGFVVGTNSDLIRDGVLPAMIFGAGAGALWKLLWDGAQFVATDLPPLDAGTSKLINLTTAYLADATGGAVQVGYGSLGTPQTIGSILVGTLGVSGANDGIWLRTTSGWVQATPPVAAAYWRFCAASPFNRNEWIIVGNSNGDTTWATTYNSPILMADGVHSAVWHTTDAGATWEAIDVRGPSAGNSIVNFTGAMWLKTGGYAVTGRYGTAPGTVAVVWRSTGYQLSTTIGEAIYAAPGTDGDVLFGQIFQPVAFGSALWPAYVSLAGVYSTATTTTTRLFAVAVVPGSTAAWAINGDTGALWHTDNYRSTSGWAVVDASHNYGAGTFLYQLATRSDGTAIAKSTDTVYEITPAGAVTTIYTDAGGNITNLAAATTQAVAMGPTGFQFYDGTSWAAVAFPGTLGTATLGVPTVIEVTA